MSDVTGQKLTDSEVRQHNAIMTAVASSYVSTGKTRKAFVVDIFITKLSESGYKILDN